MSQSDLYDLHNPPRINRIFAILFLLALLGVVLLLGRVAALEGDYDMDALKGPVIVERPDGTGMVYTGPVGGIENDPRVGPAALRAASAMGIAAVPLLLIAALILRFPTFGWGRIYRIFSYGVPEPNALWFWFSWTVAYLCGFGGAGLIAAAFVRLP